MSIALFVSLAILSPQKQVDLSVDKLGRMAATEYLAFSPNDMVLHQVALKHFRSLPKSHLKSELAPVLSSFKNGSDEWCGAAYVMALHGVDVEANVGRLAWLADDWAKTPRQVDNALESLPEALADIALRNSSERALQALLLMPSDGFVAEEQCDEALRVFNTNPNFVYEVAAGRAKLEKQLVFALAYQIDGEKGKWDLSAMKAPLDKLSHSKDAGVRAWTKQLVTRIKKERATYS